MRPAAPRPHRTHLNYRVWLDTPVGLTPPRATPAGPERAIVFPGNGGLGGPEARADGAQPGRLALVTIRNQGTAPVPCADLTALLGLAFPGRQVLAARVSDAPAGKEHRRPASRPAASVATAAAAPCLPGSGGQGQAHLAGDFQLRPKDACTIVVILSGTPAAGPRRVRQDGMLADGKVTVRSCR